MQIYRKSIFVKIIATIVLTALFLLSGLFPNNSVQAATHKPWIGITLMWAKVQMGTTAKSYIVTTYPPHTKVTIYATVFGQTLWRGISNWYRISSFDDVPLYIYGGRVIRNNDASDEQESAPSAYGKVIVVSLSHEKLYAYQNGGQVFSALVIVGRPTLPTPTGIFHIFAKLNQATFYSPWARDSQYWYAPTHINHALEFLRGGYFLHDSWWHTVYGPGTDGWHRDPAHGWQWGTHGCVAMPDYAASWLYHWAPIGTMVQIKT